MDCRRWGLALTVEEFLKLRQEGKLISAKEAAYKLDYSLWNIYKLCNMGKLTGIKMFGKLYIYSESLDNFWEDRVEEF